MIRKIVSFLFIISLFATNCGIFQPEKPKGSINIIITKAGLAKLQHTTEQLASVQCIVKKGNQSVYNQNLSKQGNSFSGEINGLDPASNYLVLLYGKNSNAEIIARGLKDNISVSAGRQTNVSLNWNSFTPTLVSPANESVIETDTPTLDWSDVNGAVAYQLVVAKDIDLANVVVDYQILTTSQYEFTSYPQPNGLYFWSVRCKDNEGNWGGWTEKYQFTISRAALSINPTTLDFGDNEISKTFTINNTGAGTLNWQITNKNRNWISVNPPNGAIATDPEIVTVTVDRSGLNAGNYSGTFWVKSNVDSQLVTINLSVPQGPTLAVNPTTLNFETNETDKTFSISNTGSGTLTWEISADSSWININPTNGTTTTETDHIGVTIDRTGLTPGDYTGHVSVTSDGGNETVAIKMSIPEGPTFNVNPRALDFGTTETTKTFTITNPSEPTLNWAIFEDSNWLTVNPASGSTTVEADQVTVTVDRAGLNPGNYATHISINNNFSVDPVKVSISMSVPEAPVLSVNPTSLDFGDAETSKTFTISNAGTGTLTWDITDDSNWITAYPTSSVSPTETNQIAVTVDRAGLNAGDYRGTVSITSNGGDESVTVKMSVSEAPILSLYPSTLDFGPNDVTKPFVIKNAGNGTLTWDINDDRVWIEVNPTTGSTRDEVDTLMVTINRGVISTIRESGTITVTSNGGTETIKVNIENEIIGDNLIAYYPFDGNANDSSGNDNHGVIHGSTTQFVPGVIKNAIKFDNSNSGTLTVNDYVHLPNITISEMTVSHWVKFERGSSSGYSGSIYSIGSYPTKQLRIGIKNDGTAFGQIVMNNNSYNTDLVDLSDKEWHHVAVSVEKNYISIYMDGSKASSTSLESMPNFIEDYQYVALHRFSGNRSSRFTGELDNLCVFGRALSEQEISDLYNDGGMPQRLQSQRQ